MSKTEISFRGKTWDKPVRCWRKYNHVYSYLRKVIFSHEILHDLFLNILVTIDFKESVLLICCCIFYFLPWMCVSW